jgi:hypothetical protein
VTSCNSPKPLCGILQKQKVVAEPLSAGNGSAVSAFDCRLCQRALTNLFSRIVIFPAAESALKGAPCLTLFVSYQASFFKTDERFPRNAAAESKSTHVGYGFRFGEQLEDFSVDLNTPSLECFFLLFAYHR